MLKKFIDLLKLQSAQDSGIFRQIPLAVPGKLYTSPMPYGAYDYHNKLISVYKQNRINHVFLLVTDDEINRKSRKDLLDIYSKNGIGYSRYIIKDFQSPANDLMKNLVTEALERLNKDRVVVHCHAGVGRTAVVVSCIVMAVTGMAPDNAIEHVRKNMTINITSEQKNLIRKFGTVGESV